MIQLENEFRVPLPVQETWELLTDLPRVAGCLPGASLDEVVDGEYRGGLSSRIGPITAKYRGAASFLEHDEVGHRAVIAARGREEAGGGAANATITAVLSPEDGRTRVNVSTSLAISGRAAQFGRSLLAEVSTSMVDEFVRRLEAMIQGADADATPDASSAKRTGRTPSRAETDSPPGADSLDLGRTVVLPMLRRSALPLASAAAGCVLGLVIGHRARRHRPIGYVLRSADLPLDSPVPVFRAR